MFLLPVAWLLTVGLAPLPASSGQTNSPAATPTPEPTPTPRTGYLALDPTFGPPGSKVTVSGTQFQPGQQVQLYFDAADKTVGNVAADQNGSFKADLQIPDVAAGPHTICSPQANLNAPCANFRVEPKPSPTPSDTPSATPAATPSTQPTASPVDISPTPTAERLNTVALLTQPPFVFFPLLLLLAAAGAAAWIWWGRRPQPAPVRSAVVRHTSTPTPAPRPAAPPASPTPVAVEEPAQPSIEEAPAAAPPRAAPADESIDMPQPGD